MAGPEPKNDFEELISLGILPNNIWAFESKNSTYQTALNSIDSSNFKQPKLIKSSIEHFFENTPKKFDIVYIDACCSLISDQHALKCIATLFKYHRLNSPGILISNFAEIDATNPILKKEYLDIISRYFYIKRNNKFLLKETNNRIEFYDDFYSFKNSIDENFDDYYGNFITEIICDRATYIGDKIVGAFKEKLENDEEFLKKCQVIFMPPRKQSLEKRDRVNYILTRIRSVLAMRFIPIQSYASASAKSEVIHTFHLLKVSKMPISDNLILFEKVLNKVYGIKTNLDQINSDFSENILLFEVLFWAISIVYIKDKNSFDNLNIIKIAADFENSQNLDVFWKNIPTEKRSKEAIFFSTGSHYYMATINRYTFVANYFNSVTNIDFSNSLKDKNKFDEIMCKQDSVAQFKEFKLSKTDPVSATVYDILNDVQNSKFILRPDYQRSEVHNAKQKASYLLESILLGIRIPPIFIYRRKDGFSEVIDGQQRLLSILGFLKEKYKDENGKEQISNKDGFKLNKLRFLKELNGKDIDGIEALDPKYKDRILDFQIDIVEINEDQNPNFSPIDLFVRLNSKPFPIQENTFEMWNAFMTKCYVEKIKKISSDYSGELFRSNDTRMKNEELITMLSFLAYQKRKYSIAPEDYLSIFVRNQRINIRIDTKSRVTSALGEISRVNDELFNESIDDVIDFIEKLKILCGDKFENFNQLISHTKLNTNSKTNRNFYFLWICLSRTSKDDILNDKEKIFESIQNYFYITQNIVEEDFEINEFKKNMALIV